MLAPGKSMTINVFHDLADARARWLALQERANATPFQTYEWCERLYSGPGAARGFAPLIVIIRDRTRGEDAALLPLALGPRGNLSVITFADFGLSDYAMPMLAEGAGFSSDDLLRLWPHILEALPKADLVHFDKIIPRHEGADNPLMALGAPREMKLGAWALELPEDWLDYLDRLGRKMRRDLRRKTRKMGRIGEFKTFMLRHGGDAAKIMDSLRRMRAERFAALGREDAMSDENVYAFYRGLVESGAGGMPVLSAIKLDGEVRAIVFGLLRKTRFYMLAMTFQHGHKELARCSPGLVLVAETMAELHKHGLKTYDFTLGDEHYKKDFAASRITLYEIIQPLTGQGRMFALKRRGRDALRAMWRRMRGKQERSQ